MTGMKVGDMFQLQHLVLLGCLGIKFEKHSPQPHPPRTTPRAPRGVAAYDTTRNTPSRNMPSPLYSQKFCRVGIPPLAFPWVPPGMPLVLWY